MVDEPRSKSHNGRSREACSETAEESVSPIQTLLLSQGILKTTGKWYNSGHLKEQLLNGTIEIWEDRNAPITAYFRDTNGGG